MGCCKSRGGIFSQGEDDLAGVPIKYREAVRSKDSKQIEAMFSQELDKLSAPQDDLLDNLKADLDAFKNNMLAEVRSDRAVREKELMGARLNAEASLQTETDTKVAAMRSGTAGHKARGEALHASLGKLGG